jgi:hypothetical protein
VDEFMTQLVGDLTQICPSESAQIGRNMNSIEQGGP